MPVLYHDLTVTMEAIEAVRQHPENPNNGDIEAIAESMEINGVFTPVLAQRSTGYILAGNHRYQALHSLGQHRIPVIWLDVDDDRAMKILLADNRIAALAQMDLAQLGGLLEGIAESDKILGLRGTGYDDQYLTNLRSLLSEPEVHLPESEEDVLQNRARTITCPECGHTFGGGM